MPRTLQKVFQSFQISNFSGGNMPPDPPSKRGLAAPCQYHRLLFSNWLPTSNFIETPGIWSYCKISPTMPDDWLPHWDGCYPLLPQVSFLNFPANTCDPCLKASLRHHSTNIQCSSDICSFVKVFCDFKFCGGSRDKDNSAVVNYLSSCVPVCY